MAIPCMAPPEPCCGGDGRILRHVDMGTSFIMAMVATARRVVNAKDCSRCKSTLGPWWPSDGATCSSATGKREQVSCLWRLGRHCLARTCGTLPALLRWAQDVCSASAT